MEDEVVALEEQLRCPLCGDTLFDPAILVCGHLFCYDCICYGIEFGVKSVGAAPSSEGVDGADWSPSPGKKKSNRIKKFMCPVCEQPAFKWTVNKVPQLQNFLEVLKSKQR